MKDLYNHVGAVNSIAPATHTASATGAGIDLQGFEGAVVMVAVGTWTDGSHTFEVQESGDNSTFAAVADADLQGSEPVVDGADDDATVYKIGYLGTKRYVRVVATVSGTTTGAVYGASVLKGYARKQPVS